MGRRRVIAGATVSQFAEGSGQHDWQANEARHRGEVLGPGDMLLDNVYVPAGEIFPTANRTVKFGPDPIFSSE
jgi:hypothetical protein